MSDTQLDAQELFHLALQAMKQQQHTEAVTLLKQAVAVAPEQGQMHYLLGAEYAQIGLYERAIVSMAEAVRLAPDLHLAVFQLGLLHLSSGSAMAAEEAWAPLFDLAEDNPLRCFVEGLRCLSQDDFSACRTWLTQGMALNQAVPELNQDMANVLAQLPVGASAGEGAVASPLRHSGQSVYVNAYADVADDDKLH